MEQTKLHNATVGVLLLNNSFVGAAYALQVLDDTTPRELVIENNVWMGPSPAPGGRTVNWDQPLDPPTYTAVTPTDGTLAPGSDAIDHGMVLPNVTDGYQGAAPDLGAQETGCPVPIYGVRPEGVDESSETTGCAAPVNPGDGGAGGSDAGATGDAGADADAAVVDGAAPGASGTSVDGGAAAAGSQAASKGGCGCSMPGAGRPPSKLLSGALALVALVALARIRRRHSPRVRTRGTARRQSCRDAVP